MTANMRRYPTPAITVSIAARTGSVVILHGRTPMLLFLTTITSSSTPFSVKIILLLSVSLEILSDLGSFPATVTYRRLNSASSHCCSFHALTAIRDRKMVPRMIRKMQVPAYPPTDVGVHIEPYSGVMVLVKKVMDIMDMDMDVVSVVLVELLVSILLMSIFVAGL